MDSREFGEWMAFYRIHPFGEENLYAARALAMFYNAHRGKDKPELGAEDFMLKSGGQQENIGAKVRAAFKQLAMEGKDHANNLAGR